VTPSEQSDSSSRAKDTGDLVRELLSRSGRSASVRSNGNSSRSPAAESNGHTQLIASSVDVTSPWEAGHAPVPARTAMPALSAEDRAERAKRPIPHPLPTDARDPEIYRMIYGGLKLPRNAPVAIIGITSAIRGEGRTTIARLMAQTLSKELGARVTLVEADLENPTLLLDSPRAGAQAGLVSLLRDECQVHEITGRWSAEYPDLYVIPAGQPADDAPRLLRLLGRRDPFRGPAGLRGLVILDLPPLVSGSNGAVACEVADATVLVVRAGVTQADTVREAIARLGDRPPQGVVLNGFRSPIPGWMHRSG
jgi:Mrp family chromosome partitioning ATPase